MSGYTKLFNSILASTIWREDDKTRIVWITMLAMADRYGVVEGSAPGLASFANVSMADCLAALERLSGPDAYSRTQEQEGRRIRAIEGGWEIINHAKYREKMGADERREYNRIAQAKWRERHPKSTNVNDGKSRSITVNENKRCHDIAEAEAEAEAEAVNPNPPRSIGGSRGLTPKITDEDLKKVEAVKALATEVVKAVEVVNAAVKRFVPPTEAEVALQCAKIGLPEVEGEKFFNHHALNEWRYGKAKTQMKRWTLALTNWKLNYESGRYIANGQARNGQHLRGTSTPTDKDF